MSPVYDLAQAAANIQYIEKARIFVGTGCIRLGDQLDRHADFQEICLTTTVRNYTLQHAVLDAHTGRLSKNGSPIADTGCFVSNDRNERSSLSPSPQSGQSEDGDLIIGFNNRHSDYRNWLTQCLPAIDWSLRLARTRDVRLLLPELMPWQEDFLRLLGYGAVPRIAPRPNGQYSFSNVQYSEFLNGTASLGVCTSLRETAARILRALPPDPSPHKILYVAYPSPSYGQIGNAAEVADLLERYGVHIVRQDRLTTVDRLRLFRDAAVVIGPHCGGLADILFAPAGTLLWEWMPRHYQNASFCCLAQTCGIDYWGDLFDSKPDPQSGVLWEVDLVLLEDRLAEISQRLASQTVSPAVKADTGPAAAVPAGIVRQSISELMLAFESLGDNCEFGMVQRHVQAEPASLLRFAGIAVPGDLRIPRLIDALNRRFEGLGAEGTIAVSAAGPDREFLIHESSYELMCHTFVREGELTAEELEVREAKRFGFFRRKLFKDLEIGQKIWIWKSIETPREDQVRPLIEALRTFGPNKLLWVVEADESNPAGTVERLDPDFVRGYIQRIAPYEQAADIHFASWVEVCERVYDLYGRAP